MKLNQEAKVISTYLCGKACSEELAIRYQNALLKQQICLSAQDEVLWEVGIKSTFMLASIDAGLAILESKSQIRRKIFLMLAILEASTEYCSEFIPKKQNIWLVFGKLGWAGVRAVFFAIIGIILIKINRIGN